MKKRIASVLVALVMVLSLVPKTSWAWTSTVTTLEQLKSAISELSYNNTIEIVVSGTIEISETLNIRPTRTTNGSMAWYEYYNQRVVISGADANSKLVRAEGFKGSLFNLTGEQGYSGAGGSDHPAYAALTLKDITVDGGGDKTAATDPAIYLSRYSTLTLDDGAVLRNCKSQHYDGGAAGLYTSTSEFVMNGTARMEDNEADYGGGVYIGNILASFTMNGGTIANNTATKYGGGVYCEASKQYGSEDTAKINLNGGTITGNTAGIAGGGVYFGGMTTCKVAGTVNITGNTQGDDKAASNLHVAASAEDQAVLAGNVSSDSRIGLNADLIPAYRIVRGSSDTNVFTSDRTNCAVTKNGSVSFNLDLLANEEHTHCVCLQNQSYGPYHDHDQDTKWVGISSLKSVKSYGCYYLLNDVTTTDEGWGSDLDDVRICLNGHNIILENGYYRPYIHVTNYHTLTITDCAEEAGQITRKDTADPKGTCIVEIDAGCKFNMFGGEITGLDSSENSAPYPAAVFNRGTFNLCGGKITGNKSHAVYNENATMNLYGGEISGNDTTYTDASAGAAVVLVSGSTLNMTGGTIKDNISNTLGGGVYVKGLQSRSSTMNFSGGEISGNRVNSTNDDLGFDGGGGVYVDLYATLDLSGTARISGNYACAVDYKESATFGGGFGGGVYVAGTFDMRGGEICDNFAGLANYKNKYGNDDRRGGDGGGVYLYSKSSFSMSGGSIQDNTVDDRGGGVFVRGYGNTITLSGRSIIQNNVDKDNQDNNLYLENSSQQVSARRLSSGADIGISSGRTLASGQTVQISSDACTGSIQYVSADRAGYETYLNSEGLIYLRLKTYQVSVTLPNGLTYKNGGRLTQDCLDLTPITISVTDPDNYYIPDGYSVTLNGITAAKVDSYTIRVTGTATADTAMTLTAPTEKTAQTQPPTGLTVTHPQSRTGYGRINGTNSSMEYRPVGGTRWSQCGSAFTSALAGTYEVRYAATETRKPSPSTTVTLNQYLEAIPVPTVYGPFTYNGNWQYGLLPGEVYGYELVGSGYRACRVGTYTVTVRPAAGFKWSDGTTGEKKLQWEIVKRTPTAGDFTFTAPGNLEYDGTAKEATVRWSTGSNWTMGMGYWPDNTFTVLYKQNGKVVAAPTDMGTYQVYVTVPGNEDINAVSELTDPSWTFTITHTGNHRWGDWQHDDTQHWRSCAVPGCQVKGSLGSHDGTATCTDRATCSICGATYGTTDPNHHDLTHHDGTAATCTQPGSLEYWQCSDCHKLFADAAAAQPITDTVIPATHHANARRTAGDPATCTQDGCAAYWYCPDCASYFADADGKLDESKTYTGPEDFYQEAMGHSFTHYVYDNNATYDADGTETAQCDHGCGLTDTRTKVGSKLIDEAAPAVEGVTDGGTYCLTAEITVTDPNLESVTLNGQPVELVDGKLTVSAAEGVQTLTATDRFGNTVTVTFTVNAQHTEGEGKITTPATTEREGVKTYACTVCGQVLRTESVTKLPAPAEPTTPAVPTGDTGNTGLWMSLAALCGMSLAALLRTGKRKEQ